MGNRAIAVSLLALVGAGPPPAGAHPMGNISINHYAGIEIGPDSVRVKYLLDFAEIPAFRELERIDPDRDNLVTPPEREAYLGEKTAEILANLRLEVDSEELEIGSAWSRVTFPPGEGGLSTVRVAWMLLAPLGKESPPGKRFLLWNDSNYEDRVGWKEVRISGHDGIGVGKTSLRWSPASGELSEYPEEFLDNPPTDTKAWCLFGPGMTAAAPDGFEPPSGFGGEKKDDPFVRLISAERLSPGVVLASLLLAVVLGAGHALEPGHGKTLVAAYLVGSKGTVGQATLLGLIVTLTHTFSVFLLGIGVLLLSRFFVPEKLLPWMGLGSGILITIVGASMLRARWRELRGRPAGGHHHHGAEGHAHPHPHPHAHSTGHAPVGTDPERPEDSSASVGHPPSSPAPPGEATLRRILALGISGGMVPCPAGIVVLLAAVALGRTAFGLLLIGAFSLGLAAVLVGVGILFVTARRFLDRLPFGPGLANRLGLASASVVTLFGIVLAYRSFRL